jgi:hypothetical protein
MPYTLLRGSFVIRYPDLPRQGPEPDGGTIKFRPDTPALVEALPRRSGVPPDINARGISARLEAIDALETHFQEPTRSWPGPTPPATSCCACWASPTSGFSMICPRRWLRPTRTPCGAMSCRTGSMATVG